MTERSQQGALAADENVEAVTGGEAVLAMRDTFVKLAQCYLEMHEYAQARDAAEMAELLTKFENDHIITAIEWPPRIESDQYGKWLAGNADTRADR